MDVPAYRRLVRFDDIDGVAAYTFTRPERLAPTAPSPAYLDTIRGGLIEAGIDTSAAATYLASCLCGMRVKTSLIEDDELHRKVKQVADQTGRTIGEVIEDAIQESLRRAPASRSTSPLPVFGREGVMPGVDLADNATMREVMDEGVEIDARR
jgi:hypothetical protein